MHDGLNRRPEELLRQRLQAMEEYSGRIPGCPCPNRDCGAKRFHRHGQVDRHVRPVIAGVVYPRTFPLSIWRCGECGTAFRHYPPSLLPYKQYLIDDMQPVCAAYLDSETAGYGKAARERGLPWAYEADAVEADMSDEAKEAASAKQTSASTVFRWITAFALLLPFLRAEVDYEVTRRGELDLLRWEASAGKARTEPRRRILKNAYLVLQVPRLGKSIEFGRGGAPPE